MRCKFIICFLGMTVGWYMGIGAALFFWPEETSASMEEVVPAQLDTIYMVRGDAIWSAVVEGDSLNEKLEIDWIKSAILKKERKDLEK